MKCVVNMALVTLLFVTGNCHTKEDEALIKEISESFVSSLKESSFEKAKKLWATPDQMLELLKSVPKDPSDPKPDEFKKYFEKRDKENEVRFPKLIKDIEKLEINLRSLKHVSTDAKVKEMGGIKKVNMIRIEVSDPSGKKAIIRIDDGIKIGEKWYFSDKILDVTAKK